MVITNSSTLNDRYAIQSVLGEVGPFDVSYLAWDLKDECEVVLREYYPLQFSKRAANGLTLEVNEPKHFEYGLGAYTAEAHRLIDISHPNVINYQTNFKENGTIYSVSTFVAGASAYGYMTQQGGALSEEEALLIISSILEGLQICHTNNLYHGGIWPKSIHLTPNGTPILMGFSQARFQLAKHCERFELVHLPGFTAPEQAYKEVEAGPWWDIFGSAATLFYMLSGYQLNYQREKCTEEDIQSALHRETSISADLRPVLEKALSFNYKNRFESLDGYLKALKDATEHKTLLSMHTNGHHSNGQSYATSISTIPGSTSSQVSIDEDIIDVREIRPLTPEIEQPEETTHSAPDDEDIIDVREIRSLPPDIEQVEETTHSAPREAIPHMEKENQPIGQIVDAPLEDARPTSIIQQEQKRSPMLLERPPKRKKDPEAPPEKSDKEVAQLLSKMVKWQQTLIAFILGFVFLVLIGALALFAGPQLMNLVKNSSNGSGNELQSSALSAAAATPLATSDSTGATITQTDIDSLYASIRAQLEDELNSNAQAIAQLRNEQNARARTSSNQTEPNDVPVPRQSDSDQEEEDESSSEDTSEESDIEDEETTESITASDDAEESQEDENTALSDSSIVEGLEIDEAGSDEERVNELLKQREFQMYRTMGDSLLAQGFDELALQWYQSAMQQDPSDTYVAEQIRRIELSRSEITAAEVEAAAEADSLSRLMQDVTDENGIFFAPDAPPIMIDEARIHSSVRYPPACLSQTSGGRVIARAIVDEGGVPTNLMIAKSLHSACDKEVLRVLGEAQFEPALFNNQPVKAWYAFSVVFREQ